MVDAVVNAVMDVCLTCRFERKACPRGFDTEGACIRCAKLGLPCFGRGVNTVDWFHDTSHRRYVTFQVALREWSRRRQRTKGNQLCLCALLFEWFPVGCSASKCWKRAIYEEGDLATSAAFETIQGLSKLKEAIRLSDGYEDRKDMMDALCRLRLKFAARRMTAQIASCDQESVALLNLTNHVDWLRDRPLGKGVFGSVYKAKWKHSTLSEQLVVKIINGASSDILQPPIDPSSASKQMYDRLLTWYHLSQSNPYIVEFKGYITIGNEFGLVSPLYTRRNVLRYIEETPEADRGRLCDEIASGLAYLHDNGMVHGDLKPENVVIHQDGHAALCDFGVVQMAFHSSVGVDPNYKPPHIGLTISASGGTLQYLAPEIVLNGGLPTFESDVYAYGCTSLQILSDNPPFTWLAPSDFDGFIIAAEAKTRPYSDIDFILEHRSKYWILKECLNHEPTGRPNTKKLDTGIAFERWQNENIFSRS